jgi:hypothetical protein
MKKMIIHELFISKKTYSNLKKQIPKQYMKNGIFDIVLKEVSIFEKKEALFSVKKEYWKELDLYYYSLDIEDVEKIKINLKQEFGKDFEYIPKLPINTLKQYENQMNLINNEFIFKLIFIILFRFKYSTKFVSNSLIQLILYFIYFIINIEMENIEMENIEMENIEMKNIEMENIEMKNINEKEMKNINEKEIEKEKEIKKYNENINLNNISINNIKISNQNEKIKFKNLIKRKLIKNETILNLILNIKDKIYDENKNLINLILNKLSEMDYDLKIIIEKSINLNLNNDENLKKLDEEKKKKVTKKNKY